MSDNEKAKGPTPTPESAKRSKTVGIIAVVAGLLAALLSLIGVFSRGELDLLYILLFVGGMLVAVLGFRSLRKAGPKQPKTA